MADNRNNNLANAIAGWQATSGATSTSLTEPARARVADILSYPDNFEARRQVQNDFSSYAREASDLSTSLDSPQFEKAVANKYSGFQAGQTNKMAAAANLIADSETANEVANRKIDNLTQQKELNDQKVGHVKSFMKATMNPFSPLLGLFDDSYSMGKQLENLAYDESQLANLQTQDVLDDQLVLQKAFGKAGYNPLANDVIEPANRWEKQYFDELTTLQRNKISATSNKIAAKGGELEAYKAETARLKALSDILGDESKNARTIYEEAGKANERDKDYAQMGVDIYKQQSQTGRAVLKSKDQQAQLVDNALQRESDMAIAQLKAASTAETNLQKGLATEAKMADIAERAEKRGTDLLMQESKERIEASRSGRAAETSATQRYVADQGLAKAKLELQKQELKNQGKLIGGKAGSGAASGVKALTSNQISDLMSNSEAAVSSATKVMAQAPVLMAIDGGKLGNDPAVQQAYNELVSDSENLTKATADPTSLANSIAADPVAQAAVKSANKRITANVDVIKTKADKVLGTGTSQSKEVTSIRLSNNGIVPSNQRAVAENYLVSTDERSSSGTSIEGQIWNDKGFQSALWTSMRERWASLSPDSKGMVAKTTGIDPNDEKAVEKAVAQMIINMAEGGSVSGKSGGKDNKAYELAYKTLNPRAVLNDIVKNGFSYSYIAGRDANGDDIIEIKHTSGKQLYEDALSLDMTNYKASRIADNFNQQNGAKIDTTFIGDENAEFTLGKRIIDAGFSPETAIATVDQFRLASLTKSWASDYQQRSVANDNIAASLMPVLGFTDFVAMVINDDSGQGNNAASVNQQYDEIKEKIAAYGNYKIKEANYAAFIMNSINQTKKGK